MSARKGSHYERRAKRVLEAAGYSVTRAAGSHGLFDLIAIGPTDIRCVQVKGGMRPTLSRAERIALAAVAMPPNASRELWAFRKHARAPIITTI
jgi:Archaeal holliday junction resolvase (hjc)